jgi:uncharacterized membrane protein
MKEAVMHWEFIAGLVIAIPVILFPVVFIWFLNVGGILAAIKEMRARRAAHHRKTRLAPNIR